jgi:hypothetical protein
MFKITKNGFQIRFPNGIVLSTVFNWRNFCSNYDNTELEKEIDNLYLNRCFESPDAEIGIWGDGYLKDENWLTGQMSREVFKDENNNIVKGYVGFEDWLKIFDWCRKQ